MGQGQDAYRHAIDLGANSPEVLSDHAEMLVMAAGGTVTPAAEAAFNEVLKADPGNGLARFYLAMAFAQAGEPQQGDRRLAGAAGRHAGGLASRPTVAQQIAEAAKTAGIPMPELAKGTARPSPRPTSPRRADP